MSYRTPASRWPMAVLCATFALAQLWLPAHGAGEHSDATASGPTGRLIIKYRQSDSAPGFITRAPGVFDRAKWRARQGLVINRELSGRQELVTPWNKRYSAADTTTADNTGRVADAHQLSNGLGATAAPGNIEYISPEYTRQPRLAPNDPLYTGSLIQGSQSYLYDGTYSARAPGAWDISTGSETSVIAIVDTGVLPEHPELVGRSVSDLGYDFVSANDPGDFTNANDGDGRDADPTDPGDFCAGDPSSWHGTEIASVAGALSNDGQGMAGIDWNARLLHARALGRCGGTDADIIDAVRWSAGIDVPGVPSNPTPARVINLSIGGPTPCTSAWQDVIDELNALDAVMVIAAGNEGMNALRSSPANCADVITVGWSDQLGGVDDEFANYGIKVTVAAPGGDIIVATNNGFTGYNESGNTHRRQNGSSLSAAMISGTVSLMHSLNPNLTSAEVRAALQSSATPFAQTGKCSTFYCGTGVLNMTRALTMVRDNTYNPERNQERDLFQATSAELPLNVQTESSLNGYRDIRYHRIDVPVAGLLTVSSSSEHDLFGYLLDERFSVLSVNNNSGEGLQFRVASTVDAGRYYVAVERSASQPQDGAIPLSLFAEVATDQPDPFAFEAIENAPQNATVTSNTITISGLAFPALLTVSDGFYSLNGGALSNQQAMVENGDELFVAVRTGGVGESTSAAELSVGAFSAGFVVTTTDAPVQIDRTIASGGGCTVSNGMVDHTLLTLLLTAFAILWLRRKKTVVSQLL